jgi:tetratricopeptide (TPR) repeat protein
LHYDRETLRQRERTLGPTDNLTLTSKFAIARDFRFLGRYEEALDLIREVNDTLDDKKEPWYLFRLLMAADLGVSLRRSGYYRDAAREAETVFERHVALVGHDHRRSLQVAMNLINDRRLVDDLSGAQELGDETVRRCERIIGSDHPNTNAARANLALVLRVRGNPRDAVKLNDEARAGFESAFGIEHLSTITVLVNLASDYASLGDVPSARRLSEQAFELSRRVRGAEHPATLATAANLTIDRRADGDEEGSGDLLRQTLAIYDNTLTAEHPEARLAAQGGRINLNIEPVAD